MNYYEGKINLFNQIAIIFDLYLRCKADVYQNRKGFNNIFLKKDVAV